MDSNLNWTITIPAYFSSCPWSVVSPVLHSAQFKLFSTFSTFCPIFLPSKFHLLLWKEKRNHWLGTFSTFWLDTYKLTSVYIHTFFSHPVVKGKGFLFLARTSFFYLGPDPWVSFQGLHAFNYTSSFWYLWTFPSFGSFSEVSKYNKISSLIKDVLLISGHPPLANLSQFSLYNQISWKCLYFLCIPSPLPSTFQPNAVWLLTWSR